jgi:hypothetical protein
VPENRRRTFAFAPRRIGPAVVLFLALQVPGVASGKPSPTGSLTELLFCLPWGCSWRFFDSTEVSAVASYGELHVWEDGRWGYAACSECMRAIDEPGPHPEPVDPGGGPGDPGSLRNYHDGPGSGTNPWCSDTPRYWRVRDYEVLDTNGYPIQVMMFMDESFTTPQNTCGVGFIEGDDYTTGQGTFRDNFFMCGYIPGCSNGQTCTAVRNQSWKANTYPVGNYQITYTCNGVTITP